MSVNDKIKATVEGRKLKLGHITYNNVNESFASMLASDMNRILDEERNAVKEKAIFLIEEFAKKNFDYMKELMKIGPKTIKDASAYFERGMILRDCAAMIERELK